VPGILICLKVSIATEAGNNQEIWVSHSASFAEEKNKYYIVFSRYHIAR
jgi:hypothetical protein